MYRMARRGGGRRRGPRDVLGLAWSAGVLELGARARDECSKKRSRVAQRVVLVLYLPRGL